MNLSPILLALLPLVASQSWNIFGSCDFSRQLKPNEPFGMWNPGWNNLYQPGSACRWALRGNYPIQVTCDIVDIPFTRGCPYDALTFTEAGESQPRDRVCGNGSFTYRSLTNDIVIEFISSPYSSPGRFRCEARLNTAVRCNCGKKNSPKIFNGTDASRNEFPMMAHLFENTGIFCGATIINPKQVLTAAHCVANRRTNSFRVAVGDHVPLRAFDDKRYHDVARVDTRLNANHRDMDLAIVTVRDNIIFNQQVSPACLPFRNRNSVFVDESVTALGWGTLEYAGSVPGTLQMADLKIISNDRCQPTFRDITSYQMCTQSRYQDFCQFDSGGPLLWEDPQTQRLVHVGIMGEGGDCGSGDPAKNARVGAFIDWIEGLKPEGYEYCKME